MYWFQLVVIWIVGVVALGVLDGAWLRSAITLGAVLAISSVSNARRSDRGPAAKWGSKNPDDYV
jgi:hypothetical protein